MQRKPKVMLLTLVRRAEPWPDKDLPLLSGCTQDPELSQTSATATAPSWLPGKGMGHFQGNHKAPKLQLMAQFCQVTVARTIRLHYNLTTHAPTHTSLIPRLQLPHLSHSKTYFLTEITEILLPSTAEELALLGTEWASWEMQHHHVTPRLSGERNIHGARDVLNNFWKSNTEPLLKAIRLHPESSISHNPWHHFKTFYKSTSTHVGVCS